ncbi:MAG: FAD-dependent oxidoreductase, partial [Vicinamibacterales bacterium]
GMNFASAMRHVREAQAAIAPHDSADRFASLGVDVFFGEAAFADARTVDVGGARLRFRRAIVAAGGRPRPLEVPVPGSDVHTSDTIFTLEQQPRTMLIVGAGPVGCELAQAFARLGTRVTLADREPRVLPREDPDASAVIARALEGDGVVLRLGGPHGGGPPAAFAPSASAPKEGGHYEVILIAAGRVPNIEGLNLEAAGIRTGPRGIEVSDILRTTNVRVFAAGDVCSRFQFTHAADALARLALQNALFLTRQRASALVIPWCTYTTPEVAAVGPLDGEAITVPLADIDRAIVEEQADGFVRVRHRAGVVTGATIVAPHAGEMIAHVAHLVRTRGTMADLSATVFPYPTMAEGLRKAGDAYRRRSLTPGARRAFEAYFSVFRRSWFRR